MLHFFRSKTQLAVNGLLKKFFLQNSWSSHTTKPGTCDSRVCCIKLACVCYELQASKISIIYTFTPCFPEKHAYNGAPRVYE